MKTNNTKVEWYWKKYTGTKMDELLSTNGELIMDFGDCQQFYPSEGKEPNEANAKLIAAAPELLEALQDMVFIFESIFDKLPSKPKDFNCYNKAINAINKATK